MSKASKRVEEQNSSVVVGSFSQSHIVKLLILFCCVSCLCAFSNKPIIALHLSSIQHFLKRDGKVETFITLWSWEKKNKIILCIMHVFLSGVIVIATDCKYYCCYQRCIHLQNPSQFLDHEMIIITSASSLWTGPKFLLWF